jgi:hypothetical protein
MLEGQILKIMASSVYKHYGGSKGTNNLVLSGPIKPLCAIVRITEGKQRM